LFALPSSVGFIALVALSLLLLPATVGGVVYAHGRWRAFWIGSAVGATPMFIWFYSIVSSLPVLIVPVHESDTLGSEFGYTLASWHLLMMVSGTVVVVVRWFCRESGSARIEMPDSGSDDWFPNDLLASNPNLHSSISQASPRKVFSAGGSD
jgi:hypothetical protein